MKKGFRFRKPFPYGVSMGLRNLNPVIANQV